MKKDCLTHNSLSKENGSENQLSYPEGAFKAKSAILAAILRSFAVMVIALNSFTAKSQTIVFNCPGNVTESANLTQDSVNSAFQAWLSTASLSGCDALLAMSPLSPHAPSACGGSTTVTWTLSGGNCGATQTCTKTFTVAPQPNYPVTNSGPITCANPIVTLSANNCVPINFMSYFWDGGIVEAAGQCINISAPGTYRVLMTNQINGCTVSDTTTITVNKIQPPASCGVSGIITCGNPTLPVTVNNCDGAVNRSYSWSGPNGFVSSSQCLTVTDSGTYAVAVTNTTNGCTNSCSSHISKNVTNPAVTINTNGATTFCAGGNVQLSAAGQGNLVWSTGATTQSINVTSSGNYSVMVSNSSNGCTASSVKSVTVNPNPSVIITPTASTTLTQGNSIQFCAGGAANYLWSTGATSACITVSSTGIYTVTGSNATGCTGTASIRATLSPNGTVSYASDISLTVTPDQCVITEGVATPMNFTYVVTNNDKVNTVSGTIVDNNGTPSNTSDDITICSWGPLAPGASATCTHTFTISNTYSNAAIASGITSTDHPVSATATAKVQAISCSCSISYPDASSLPRSNVVFNESQCLMAFDPGPKTCGSTGSWIKLWYTDEHAMTLGVRTVVIKHPNGHVDSTTYSITKIPATPASVNNPLVGDTIQSGALSANDVAAGGGRPLWPAVFITDLTVNGPTSVIGDWQQGGKGTPPNIVSGMWKGAVKTVDSASSTPSVTVTPDPDPAKNGWSGINDIPPGGFASYNNDGYAAECAWSVNALHLTQGHIYRLVFMVHDGDQNGSGGDAGEAGTTIYIPYTNCGAPVVISASSINGSCSNGFVNSATANIIQGVAPFTYNWSNGATTSSVTNLPDGTYSLIVTDATHVSASTSVTVAQQIAPSDISLISSNFNNTAVASGNYIWFNSSVKISKPKSYPVTIRFINQNINSSQFNLSVPNARLVITATAGPATTVFNGTEWVTTVPSNASGNYFLSGYAYNLSASLAGNLNPLAWSGEFTSTDPTVSVQWQWAATSYTGFSANLNQLGIKPCDDNKSSAYLNSDHAGTPENYKTFVGSGAKGGGGNNYTGSSTGNATKNPCVSSSRLENSDESADGQPESNININAYPNPFTSATTIRFKFNEDQPEVTIEVFSMNGEKVASLYHTNTIAGQQYEITFNGEDLSQGIYLYRIIAGDNIYHGKITKLKE